MAWPCTQISNQVDLGSDQDPVNKTALGGFSEFLCSPAIHSTNSTSFNFLAILSVMKIIIIINQSVS